MSEAEIGVFGGSGFYSFVDGAEEVRVETPFGPPSAPPVVGSVGGKKVAFIPRHGSRHELPPAQINYRANVWALKELGVRRIIGPWRHRREAMLGPRCSRSLSCSFGSATAHRRSSRLLARAQSSRRLSSTDLTG